MAARVSVTVMLLLLAAANFFGGVLLPPGPLNPFGFLCLVAAGAFWFGWEMVEDAYAYQEERRQAGRNIPDPLFVKFAPQLSALPRGRALPSAPKSRKMRTG